MIAAVPLSVPAPCVCTSLRRVSRVLARAYDAALAPAGMNVTQFAVLRGIARRPDGPLLRIAADLSLDRTSLYRALTPLEGRRWVKIGEGPNARSRSVRLTPRGEKVLAGAAKRWAKVQRATVDAFGREAFRRLTAEMDRLRDSVEGPA